MQLEKHFVFHYDYLEMCGRTLNETIQKFKIKYQSKAIDKEGDMGNLEFLTIK
jgi:hypothetical protein